MTEDVGGFESIEVNTKAPGVHLAARDLVNSLVDAVGVGDATAIIVVAAAFALKDMVTMPSPMPEVNTAGAYKLAEMVKRIVDATAAELPKGPVQ